MKPLTGAAQYPGGGGRVRSARPGVYVQADADVDAAALARAVRIAHYLYPTVHLSSASAALLRPTSDVRLFLSGRRNQRTRIRTLEIVQKRSARSSVDGPGDRGRRSR